MAAEVSYTSMANIINKGGRRPYQLRGAAQRSFLSFVPTARRAGREYQRWGSSQILSCFVWLVIARDAPCRSGRAPRVVAVGNAWQPSMRRRAAAHDFAPDFVAGWRSDLHEDFCNLRPIADTFRRSLDSPLAPVESLPTLEPFQQSPSKYWTRRL